MKWSKHPHGLILAQNAPDFVRSKGLHMSDIYNSLFKSIDPGRYDKRQADGSPEEMDWTKVAAGTAWELHLEPILQARYGGSRPGELFTQHAADCSLYRRPVRDGLLLCHCGAGVAYSPDWLFDTNILGELKFSWYSLRNFPLENKFDKWLCQVQSYLLHLRMTTVWVFPYWVNGAYPKDENGRFQPPSPVFDDYYELTFEIPELVANWNALLKHAWREGLLP